MTDARFIFDDGEEVVIDLGSKPLPAVGDQIPFTDRGVFQVARVEWTAGDPFFYMDRVKAS